MKYAADFRAEARDALRGRWPIAVLTGFVASLIGANIATGGGGGGNSNSDSDSTRMLIEEFTGTEFWLQFRAIIIGLLVALVIWLIITIVIGGAGKLGYAIFNLKLVDNKEAEFKDLFSQFHRLGDGFCMNFLVGLYTVLWTLLFVIPGIIKTYSYAMTPYILAENPGMTATEAITESRRIMDGNKWRLFCLSFSFIGWALLAALLTFGIGYLWLVPYQQASFASFYREIKAEKYGREEKKEEFYEGYYNGRIV